MRFEVPPRERLEPLSRILFKPYVAESVHIDILIDNCRKFYHVYGGFSAVCRKVYCNRPTIADT